MSETAAMTAEPEHASAEINRTLERCLDTVLSRSPAQPLFRWRASRRLVVLAYHEVQDEEGFAHQMEHLASAMHPVSLDEVLAALAGGPPLPRRAVLVTFDDGDRSVYERALPILRQRGIPSVAFVIAGLLDSETPFWWNEARALLASGARSGTLPDLTSPQQVGTLKRIPDERRLQVLAELRRSAPGPAATAPQLRRTELRRMEAAGMRIGNHTLTHPCLNRCSPERIRDELLRAHQLLTQALGAPPRAFAYPNGDLEESAVGVLGDLGYEAAFLFDHRVGRFPPVDRYRISRIRVGPSATPERFRLLLSGLHSSLHHAIGRR